MLAAQLALHAEVLDQFRQGTRAEVRPQQQSAVQQRCGRRRQKAGSMGLTGMVEVSSSQPEMAADESSALSEVVTAEAAPM